VKTETYPNTCSPGTVYQNVTCANGVAFENYPTAVSTSYAILQINTSSENPFGTPGLVQLRYSSEEYCLVDSFNSYRFDAFDECLPCNQTSAIVDARTVLTTVFSSSTCKNKIASQTDYDATFGGCVPNPNAQKDGGFSFAYERYNFVSSQEATSSSLCNVPTAMPTSSGQQLSNGINLQKGTVAGIIVAAVVVGSALGAAVLYWALRSSLSSGAGAGIGDGTGRGGGVVRTSLTNNSDLRTSVTKNPVVFGLDGEQQPNM
jgi:hypothetical protein